MLVKELIDADTVFNVAASASVPLVESVVPNSDWPTWVVITWSFGWMAYAFLKLHYKHKKESKKDKEKKDN